MILSRLRRLIFIKGVKVAGTSVEIALSDICGPEDIITPIAPRDELDRIDRGTHCRNFARDATAEWAYIQQFRDFIRHDRGDYRKLPAIYHSGKGEYFNHMTLAQVEALFPGDLDPYQIVCVTRSPYSRVLSLAHWTKRQGDYAAGAEIGRSLDDVRESVERVFRRRIFHSVDNIERYRRRDGRVAVRRLRYEYLQQDMQLLWSDLGIETPPRLPHAKKGVMADDLDPREFLTPRQIAQINRDFADEFDMFGFQRL